MEWDICIIGAGIAGLYCALELSKKYPTSKICVLEKYKYIGGRTSTFKDKAKGLQWEAGAGRVHKSHHHVTKLISQYRLTKIPIPNEIKWRPSPGSVEPIKIEAYINNLGLDSLSPEILRMHTLKDLLTQTSGPSITKKLTDRYEYRSEFDTQRGDKALEALENELGDDEGFFVIKEGFSALIGHMKHDIEKAGVRILRENEATDIKKDGTSYEVEIRNAEPIKAAKVIVALTRDAVAELPCFKGLPILKQVKMRPLVRIYAVFPNTGGKMWFEGMAKFVCPKPVRYVIPINPKQGIIMISYTDGEDAEYWIRKMKGPNHIEQITGEIMGQIRGLFPDIKIPDPTFLKIHPWADGCSYWTPGDYDFNKVSKASVKPLPKSMPGLYMCGESWAYNQAWVQCAIDQAVHAIDAFVADARPAPL